MPNEILFKIQDKDGEFATASSWSKRGKQWYHISHVKMHLKEQGLYMDMAEKYVDAELVTYEMVEVSRVPMIGFMQEVMDEENRKMEERRRKEDLEEKKQKVRKAKRLKQWLKENKEELEKLEEEVGPV